MKLLYSSIQTSLKSSSWPEMKTKNPDLDHDVHGGGDDGGGDEQAGFGSMGMNL